MDPISAGLLTALGVAIKNKVSGAAADYVMDASKHAAGRLRGLLPGDDTKQANALVTHVLAEAAAFPPDKAIYVEAVPNLGALGIWEPRGQLGLNLLWINRADFQIRVRDLKVTARVGGGHHQWEINHGDEFVLPPRSDTFRIIRGEPSLPLPRFERGVAECEVKLHALVCGPWEHGLAQRTHRLYDSTIWIPVHLSQLHLLSEPADVDIALEAWFQRLLDKGVQNQQVTFASLDAELKLSPGETQKRLAHVAAQLGHKFKGGPNVGYLTLHYTPEYLDDSIRGGSGLLDDDF